MAEFASRACFVLQKCSRNAVNHIIHIHRRLISLRSKVFYFYDQGGVNLPPRISSHVTTSAGIEGFCSHVPHLLHHRALRSAEVYVY
jgi:hypothetical protein